MSSAAAPPPSRREQLVESAASIVAADGVEAVSMESVADVAGVSRALVYKHFANRADLLVAVHQRESARLHVDLSSQVTAAATVEDMFVALVHGSLEAAVDGRGAVFAALRQAGAHAPEIRLEQRRRDGTTVRAFAKRLTIERHMPADDARALSSMLLGLVNVVSSQFHGRPTKAQAAHAEAAYARLVTASIAAFEGAPTA